MSFTPNTGAILRGSISRGVRHVWRQSGVEKYLLLLFCAFLLIQSFSALLLLTQGVHRLLVLRSSVYVELHESARDQDIQELYAALRQQTFVESVQYIPPEQAYDRGRVQDPGLIAFLEEYNVGNPFPDTFAVGLRSVEGYTELSRFLQGDPYRSMVDVSFLQNVSTQERDARGMLDIVSAARVVLAFLLFIAIVLLCALLGILLNVLRPHGRSQVLEHMLGAPPSLAHMALVTEVATLALVALLGATGVLVLLGFLLPFAASSVGLTAALPLLTADVLPAFVVLGPFILVLEVIVLPPIVLAVSRMERVLPKSATPVRRARLPAHGAHTNE